MSKRARKTADGAAQSKPRDSIVGLNVGGQRFQTLLSTLRNAPGSVLDRMFDEDGDYGEALRDQDGNVFIDADPEAFPFVLNFLRHGRCIEASSMSSLLAAKVGATADYFGLVELAEACAVPTIARPIEGALENIAAHLENSTSRFEQMRDHLGKLGHLESIDARLEASTGRLAELCEIQRLQGDHLGYLEVIAGDIEAISGATGTNAAGRDPDVAGTGSRVFAIT